MKRIKCSNCPKTFAHLLDSGTIEFARKQHKAVVIGGSYTMVGSCPYCESKTTVIIKDGKIIEDGITFKEDKPNEPVTGQTTSAQTVTTKPTDDPEAGSRANSASVGEAKPDDTASLSGTGAADDDTTDPANGGTPDARTDTGTDGRLPVNERKFTNKHRRD